MLFTSHFRHYILSPNVITSWAIQGPLVFQSSHHPIWPLPWHLTRLSFKLNMKGLYSLLTRPGRGGAGRSHWLPVWWPFLVSQESGSLQPLGKEKRKRPLENKHKGIINQIFQECIVTPAQTQGLKKESSQSTKGLHYYLRTMHTCILFCHPRMHS